MSYASAFLQLGLLLLLFAVSVFGMIWFLQKRSSVFRMRNPSRIEILERVPLDVRRTLYLLRMGDKTWLLAFGEGGEPLCLDKGKVGELPALPEQKRVGWGDLLRR